MLELAARIFLMGGNEHEIYVRTFVAVTFDERSADKQREVVGIIFETIDQPIDRAEFGGVSWLDDGSGFFYWRARKLGPNDPPTLKYQNSKTFLHKIGNDPEKDDVVFGP